MTVGVVIATRNRRERLLTTLEHLGRLPDRPPVVVVDNGSIDGTGDAVRSRHHWVEVLPLGRNFGAAARNYGVQRLATDAVAFCDDDSWWEPPALGLADALLRAHADLGLVAARVLVGPENRLDTTCTAMAESPLEPRSDLPGPRVLGFLACAAVVRRSAFLDAGGFHARLGVGGEEELLALDLRSAGWELVYADRLVAHHHPQRLPRPERVRTQLRNRLWVTWLRRSPLAASRQTLRLAGSAGLRDVAVAFADAAAGLPWVLPARRPLPAAVEEDLRALERQDSLRHRSG